MNLRDELNNGDPNRTDGIFNDLRLGELINKLLTTQTPTEAALVPASDVITLAAQPSQLFDVNVATGTVTGRKELIKGVADAAGVITPVPATGQATWDGGTKVRLAAADAALTVNVLYATAANPTASYLQRDLGQQNS
jgi:hypothetical protein